MDWHVLSVFVKTSNWSESSFLECLSSTPCEYVALRCFLIRHRELLKDYGSMTAYQLMDDILKCLLQII